MAKMCVVLPAAAGALVAGLIIGASGSVVQDEKTGTLTCLLQLNAADTGIENQVSDTTGKEKAIKHSGAVAKKEEAKAFAPAVALGGFHSALLKADRTVWTAGYGGNGRLGDAGTADRETFEQVLGDAQAVALGWLNTAAVKADGTVWTAGAGDYGQLGDSGNADRGTFEQVLGDAQAVALCWYHTAALKADGTVWTSGRGNHGQLGDAGTADRNIFEQVLGDAQAVALGQSHTAALKGDGTVWTAGRGNEGQLGDAGKADRGTFEQVLSDAQAVALGDWQSAALKADGTVWTTGLGGNGQLGDGGRSTRYAFEQVQQLGVDTQAVAVFNKQIAALKADGTLWTSGRMAGRPEWYTFQQVFSDAQAVAVGGNHIAALKADGTLWTAGSGGNGQLGDAGWATRGTFEQVLEMGTLPPTPAPAPPTPSPTPAPTTYPTTSPTATPTAAPTEATPTPTAVPTTAISPTGNTAAPASAVGDPHITNLVNVSFDVNKPGEYVLLRVPFDNDVPALFELRAKMAPTYSSPCGLWITEVTISGDGFKDDIQIHAAKTSQSADHFALRSGPGNTSVTQSWRPWAEFTKDVEVALSNHVTVLPAFRDFQGWAAVKGRKVFELLIGTDPDTRERVSITVAQLGKPALDVNAKRIAKFGASRIGGLLGTEDHNPSIEEPSLQCAEHLKSRGATSNSNWDRIDAMDNSASASMLFKKVQRDSANMSASW